jgi:signal transduction histidine kinase
MGYPAAFAGWRQAERHRAVRGPLQCSLRGLRWAGSRVSAVAKAHERIHQGNGPDWLDLGVYVGDVCHDMNNTVPGCRIEVTIEPGIKIMTDRAVPIVLIANELITNAAKYAYQDSQSGTIWVRVGRGADDTIGLSVRDEGRGFPTDFELCSGPGLGMRALSWQLDVAIECAVSTLAPNLSLLLLVKGRRPSHLTNLAAARSRRVHRRSTMR